MGKMTVYHGSYTSVTNPKIIIGRNTKDFGVGFYCTILREQAERWAKRYDTPFVSAYTVRMNTSLNILEFKEMTEEWLDLREQFWIMAKFKYPTHQINFCTEKALECLEFVSSREVSI